MNILDILRGIKAWTTTKIQNIDITNILGNNYYADEDGIYIQKIDGKVYPLAHPDLSTQPSILPQRFGAYQIREVLIPNPDKRELLAIDPKIVPFNSVVISVSLFNKDECMTGASWKQRANMDWPYDSIIVSPTNAYINIFDFALIKYIVMDDNDYNYSLENVLTNEETIIPTPEEVESHIGEEVTDENRKYDLDNDGDIDHDDWMIAVLSTPIPTSENSNNENSNNESVEQEESTNEEIVEAEEPTVQPEEPILDPEEQIDEPGEPIEEPTNENGGDTEQTVE